MRIRQSRSVRARQWLKESAPQFVFGLCFSAVGLGLGWFLWSDPQLSGLRWFAVMLVCVLFALGGAILMTDALGLPRARGRILRATFWLMMFFANFVTFTSPEIHCRQQVALFGVPLLTAVPEPEQCRVMAILIIVSLDALLFGGAAWFWWKARVRKPL